MGSTGFSAKIHKVADNDKRQALFLGLAFLCIWVVAVNYSVQTLSPRWFQREFDWLASESIAPIFLSAAAVSLFAAALLWLLSGDGNKLFDIDSNGIARAGAFGATTYSWSDFELLEREVATIILHLKPAARTSLGPKKIAFDLSGIDCSGPKLEALIVHYRPDLYRTLHVANTTTPMAASKTVKPVVAARVPDNLLRARISRIC